MNFVDVKTLPAHARNGADAQSSYPLITIAIPTYNRSGLVKSCVENALAQSYRNIDVMVSDNASPDDTLAVLKTVNDKRLRVLTNPKNVGAIENHAKCLREAKGDYLVLVSDDNILDAQFLEKCVRLIRQEPGLPIVLAAYDNLILDEFHEGDRRLVPAIVSKRLSTGIWDGIEVLREYFHGRLSAELAKRRRANRCLASKRPLFQRISGLSGQSDVDSSPTRGPRWTDQRGVRHLFDTRHAVELAFFP